MLVIETFFNAFNNLGNRPRRAFYLSHLSYHISVPRTPTYRDSILDDPPSTSRDV
jgi:hypothetical protein